MNETLVTAMGSEPGQVEQILTTFGVDWPHLAAQAISFGIVCLILHRFAFRPVQQALEERRRRIEQGLADAEKAKAELAQAEARSRDLVAEAAAAATRCIAEAREAAARVLQQETAKALAEAARIAEQAKEVNARERERMLAELKRDVGRLVVQTAVAVTGKVLTAEDQRRLAEEAARGVAPDA